MYLNRFTISAPAKESIPIEKLKPFNLIYSEIEENLFKVMPRKINVGGYGYVSIKLHVDKKEKDWVKEYGQCAECNLHSYQFDLAEFLRKERAEQRNEILSIYERGINLLADYLEVDRIQILEAINHIRKENKTQYNKT
jgi:hypothetical protein